MGKYTTIQLSWERVFSGTSLLRTTNFVLKLIKLLSNILLSFQPKLKAQKYFTSLFKIV
jgi:hypothetical protein